MNVSCIIVDDEPIAREGLKKYAERIPFLTINALAQDTATAVELLQSEQTDLMFLDINMPGMSGLQLLKSLEQPPLTIICSAHAEHAVDAFDLHVIDYIVKPVSFDRFSKAVTKAKEFLELRSQPPATAPGYFFIKEGSRIEKINTAEIIFIESLQNYAAIVTAKRKYIALLSLKMLEQNLPSSQFVKVHKSYIVNIAQIDSIEGDEILVGSHRIPISRSQKDAVINTIVGSRLLKRN